jgi:peptidoglycan/LPS O-acetylase OafA/YrhL
VYGVAEQYMTAGVTLPHLLAEAFFVQNYLPGLWNHTWSLAVEEHFYLLIGLAVSWLTARNAIRSVPWLCLAVCVGCFGARLAAFQRLQGAILFQSHFRFDALAFGVLLSYAFYFRRSQLAWVERHRVFLVAGAVAALVPTFLVDVRYSRYVLTLGLTINYLAFGAVVIVAALAGARASLRNWLLAGIATLGSYSYSVYLWHMPAKRILSLVRRRGWISWPYPVELALFFVLTFCLGIAMARLIEFPVLRLRDRFCPSRGSGVERPSTAAVQAAV